MNGLNYLLQTNLYLLLFMGFYVLVLRNETFFRQNRFFLNTSIFLSFLIPFINSEWFRDLFITQKVREAAVIPSQMIYETVIVGINEETSSLSVSDAIFWIYTSGATFLLFRFLIRLAFLKSKLKGGKGAAFSFFNTLVVDNEMPKADTIIGHEKVHMRQWHSADIIFIELAAIVNWFNPVMYLYKKEIRHIHEFIADEEAAALMQSKSDYAMLLFSNTLGVDPLHLSNNFFNKSLLKRRILMLHKNRSRSTGLWKYGFSAPLFILMLIVSAATVKSEAIIIRPVAETILSPLSPETSESILSAIDLEKSTTTAKKSQTNEGPKLVSSEGSEVENPQYTLISRHLMRNLKYPASARQNNVEGFAVANFSLKDKKIKDVQIEKGLQADIDADIIRALSLYSSELDLADGKYFFAVGYRLSGSNVPVVDVPNTGGKNFVGRVVVTAMGGNSLKGGSTGDLPDTQEGELSQFPGGLKAWTEYISKNLRYPSKAKENNIEGRVIVSFVVDTDGSIRDIKVLRGIGAGADEEAVRIVAQSPKWKPVIKDGVPARSAYTMPIAFSLTGTLPQNPHVGQNVIIPNRSSTQTEVLDFTNVDVLPEPPAGMAGWAKYLSANLKYPELAKKEKVTGRVVTSFVVEKDGKLSEIKVLKGLGSGLDEEAVRVLNSAPHWKPGILDGRPVRVAYTMPILFQLSN